MGIRRVLCARRVLSHFTAQGTFSAISQLETALNLESIILYFPGNIFPVFRHITSYYGTHGSHGSEDLGGGTSHYLCQYGSQWYLTLGLISPHSVWCRALSGWGYGKPCYIVCYIILHSQYNSVTQYIVLHNVTMYMVLHSVKQCNTVLHCITQCYIVLHYVIECYSITQYIVYTI